MKLSNDVVLRPRFQIEMEVPASEVIRLFNDVKKNQKKFGIVQIEDHIFIRLPKEEQFFWSPQLHLEIEEKPEGTSLIKGFYGPNPQVWTFFIFLHVVVGTLFLINLIWIYSNLNLNKFYGLQIGMAIGLVIAWALLYLAGSVGKQKGKPGMLDLHRFILVVINRDF